MAPTLKYEVGDSIICESAFVWISHNHHGYPKGVPHWLKSVDEPRLCLPHQIADDNTFLADDLPSYIQIGFKIKFQINILKEIYKVELLTQLARNPHR
jgi:hypothetical protein